MSRSKKIMALFLSIVMVLGLLPASAFAANDTSAFSDVKTSAWYHEDVQYVSENGLMKGTGENLFSPDATTTRGMIVTILYRLEGEPSPTGACPFQDVASGKYYEKAITWAAENGIVSGFSADTFGPDQNITREQMAAILYRYATYKKYDVSTAGDLSKFPDADKVSSYAVDAMKWANAAGLINGSNDGKLYPAGNATRAQVAAILTRFCKNIAAQCTVTFQLNYGSEGTYTTLKVAKGDTITAPKAPTRSGYTFSSWSEKTSGSAFDFKTPIEKDITLYAQWNKRSSSGSSSSVASYTVTFDANGGSKVESQTIRSGEHATQPSDPEKENCTFIGWYCNNGYSDVYDFNTPINHNTTVYAKWFDTSDTEDSDGDGLSDALEKEFGTDHTKADTDNDGIPDYIELDWLNYDPTSPDTDKNGILDVEEDPDGDGLTNGEEVRLGTNPIARDSDSDGLSDYDEVNKYHTNPLEEDTDSDGVKDGIEIELGTNPLVVESQFTTSMDIGAVDEFTTVAASAKVNTDAKGAGTLQIEEVTPLDNPLLSENIAGYLGSAYNFSTDGEFESAEITFSYNTNLGQIGEDFQPRIYYFNEETGLLEELPDQDVTNGKVKARVSHFSTYILLNKSTFDEVWNREIRHPNTGEETQQTMDIVFVIDYSASMKDNDPNQLYKELSKGFINKLQGEDRAGVVKFIKRATLVCGLTKDKDRLTNEIDKIVYDDGYRTYSGTDGSTGIKLALDQLEDSSATYKYVIFMTDGEDNQNTYSYDSLIEKANKNNISIYTIGLGSGTAEDTLKMIASKTTGNYYFASIAEDLNKVYDDISFETVDYTTDSNNDGISDYYTKLLNDGDLVLSTGCYDLVDVIEMYGKNCDDWDGDGLKNGEEIQVCVVGKTVYIKMYSHPLLADSDGDGYSDAVEKKLGLPPMKFTSGAYSSLQHLEDDDGYVYPSIANDRSIIANINAFFDWQKTDEAKEQLISYFYDYASKEAIDKNQEHIAKLKAHEEYLKCAQSLANILKVAKDVYNITDDISEMTNGLEYTGDAKEFIDEARAKNIGLKGASAEIRKSRKQILDAMNTNRMSEKDTLNAVASVSSKIDNIDSLIEDFDDFFKGYDSAISAIEGMTSIVASVTSYTATAVETVKVIKDNSKYMKFNTGFRTISDGYKKFVENKGSTSVGTYLTVAVDVVDGGLKIWENCNTYGKIKANRDAYIAYIDLLYYITENAADKYDRTAADALVKIVQDETWNMYEKQLSQANTKTVVLTTLDIVTDVFPEAKVAKSVYTIAKVTIKAIGLNNNAKLLVNCRTVQSISDGCINIIESNIEKDNLFFSYGSNELAYMSQLAQSRLVGEDYAKRRLQKGDLAAFVYRWLEKAGKDEIEELFKTISGGIYSSAANLNLELSSALPYYSDFCGSTGG